MKPYRATPSRGLRASTLLAGTSVAALLLGGAPALAGGLSFNGQTQASVTNPANTTVTSIVINNSTVTGAVTNAGTITPGKAGVGFNGGTAALAVTNNSTIGGGIHNSGAISATGSGNNVIGILISSGNNASVNTIAGGISNTGTISASGGGGFSDGLLIRTTTLVIGDITNTGMISGGVAGVAISGNSVNLTTITGRIVNTGTISNKVGQLFVLDFATVSGGILNTGAISAGGGSAAFAEGVVTFFGGVSGGFTNTGTISALATGAQSFGTGVFFGGTTVTGGVTNTGMIRASSGFSAIGLAVQDRNSNPILSPTGNVFTNGIISGGVTNSGTIAAVSSAGPAIGLKIGEVIPSGVFASLAGTISGGITNTGTISAAGKTGTGILITGGGTISGGITNTGTISGNTAAIDISGEGGPTVINQAGGALIGAVKLSANADVLNFSGGTIFNAVTAPAGNQALVAISGTGATFAPTASVSGVSALTIASGSRLTLGVTPTQAPSINAGTIALAGTLNLAPQGSLFAFGATHTYTNVFVADPPLSGSFTNVTTSAGSLFQASLSPDPTTANALDLTLALSQTGLAASAQDLTQSLRLGLDAPRVLEQAVQDRLVASGGVLGEDAWSGGAGAKGPGMSSTPIGHANVWARGFDQFGTASGSGAAPGYNVNRAAPFIGGVDWRFDNNIVAGVAATYVASSASFKDGSRTNVSSYQGAAYAGWAGGPGYALGSAVVSFNDFATTRLLTPFGLPGAATASPSGQSYAAHAEAGYHWLLPAAGTSVSVTPYAALDYVHANIDAFNEAGGFGALTVNGATGNSFATTLGARATTRINWGDHAVLVPEVRIGWSHEFGDASQSLSASLVGVPGSAFSATGINFGRDSALVGAGMSLELSPEAKVFLEYEGKFSQRLQEHSISGGLRLRF